MVKFRDKKRYSDREHEAIYKERVELGSPGGESDLDAIEALFKRLNAADEAAKAWAAIMG
jgi:hypothetical protein